METVARSFLSSAIALPRPGDRSARVLPRALGLLCFFLVAVIAGRAQAPKDSSPDSAQVFEGIINDNVYGVSKSIKINGTVKEGAIAFGGDVIVQGTVEGDVAAIGGSVVQLPGARIGGDVIVVGGTYKPADKSPIRNAAKATMVYAGYEQELQNIMRNPAGILSPSWSPTYIGLRILSILFWFVAALGLTTAMPLTVSSGVARLQLTSLRVAAIGFVGAIVVPAIAAVSLRFLPTQVGALLGMVALLFVLVAWVFGRVVICAAAGRWFQRRYFPRTGHSESVALLIGTALWAVVSSLPFVWPFVVASTLVLSFGLALTAGRGNYWHKVSAA